MTTLFNNIGCLFTNTDMGAGQLGEICDAAIVVEDGKIAWVGESKTAPAADKNVDLENKTVIPGFVDSHAHLMFAGDRAEEFSARVTERVKSMKIGRGTEEGITIGPLIDDKAVAKANELVQDALSKGATVTTGGHVIEGDGSFFEPTVVTNVKPGANILVEEIFGPVLSITTFSSEEEGIRIANDTEYGLMGYVYTEDIKRAQRLIEKLQTGMMGLNAGIISNASAPFGGVKMSGLGREGGAEGIYEYLSPKYTMTPNPFA